MGGMCSRQGAGHITFQESIHAALRCTDPHTSSKINWSLNGGGYRVSQCAWNVDSQAGRVSWDREGTQYNHGDTPRTYTTGGMSTEFDRRIELMLGQEKFHLLTSGIVDKPRARYLTCWRRWSQFASCMGKSPWIKSFEQGWDDALLDFLVRQRKILGIQHSVLTKGFYAVRYIRIVEGLEDLTLRAHRIQCIVKSVKLRGETCKKLPFTTDLIRWLRTQLTDDASTRVPHNVAQLWGGLLVAFFFCLRISEIQALTVNDIKITHDEKGSVLPIIIRGAKTDQEK